MYFKKNLFFALLLFSFTKTYSQDAETKKRTVMMEYSLFESVELDKKSIMSSKDEQETSFKDFVPNKGFENAKQKADEIYRVFSQLKLSEYSSNTLSLSIPNSIFPEPEYPYFIGFTIQEAINESKENVVVPFTEAFFINKYNGASVIYGGSGSKSLSFSTFPKNQMQKIDLVKGFLTVKLPKAIETNIVDLSSEETTYKDLKIKVITQGEADTLMNRSAMIMIKGDYKKYKFNFLNTDYKEIRPIGFMLKKYSTPLIEYFKKNNKRFTETELEELSKVFDFTDYKLKGGDIEETIFFINTTVKLGAVAVSDVPDFTTYEYPLTYYSTK
jgi:hypothetical protein